jgi:hypothetical protein
MSVNEGMNELSMKLKQFEMTFVSEGSQEFKKEA